MSSTDSIVTFMSDSTDSIMTMDSPGCSDLLCKSAKVTKRAGAICSTILYLLFCCLTVYLAYSSVVRSNHTAIASPSSKVGNFLALVSSSQSLMRQQISNLWNHSTGSPLKKGVGKLMGFKGIAMTEQLSSATNVIRVTSLTTTLMISFRQNNCNKQLFI